MGALKGARNAPVHKPATNSNRAVIFLDHRKAARNARHAANVPFVTAMPRARHDRAYLIAKRIFDIAVSLTALVLLAPAFLLIAIAIKRSSPGPVFFCQDRYGLNGELFCVYKFRTMRPDDGDQSGVQQTVKDDPRVTRIGKLLRKTSFDELPQLLNILKGEMSVVGPRPHVPGMLAAGKLYEDFDSRYMGRHVVKPGLTGLAQVNGFRGETMTAQAARGRLDHDLDYIRRQSLPLDIAITARTFWTEFVSGSGY